MNRAKGHLRYYLLSSKNDILFLLGVFMVLVLFKVTSILTAREILTPNSSNLASGFMVFASFYLIGIGTANIYETFPYIMSLSSTRQEFYRGLIARYALVSLMFAALQTILYYVEKFFYSLVAGQYTGFVDMFGRKLTNGFALFTVSSAFFMLILSIFALFGFVMVRFSFKKFFIVASAIGVVVYMLSITSPGMQNIMQDLFRMFGDFIAKGANLQFILKSIVGTAIILSIGWLLIRKSEVKVLGTAEK